MAPVLQSMADTLLYKFRMADLFEQLKWVDGRAEGFTLGLNVAGGVTRWQGDYLIAAYGTAREERENQIQTQPQHRLGNSWPDAAA